MSQKQIKSMKSKRSKNVNEVLDEYDRSHKFSIPSAKRIEDGSRLRAPQTQARTLNQMINPDEYVCFYPKEFASYYHEPMRSNGPSCSVTSHSRPPNMSKTPTIPTYSILDNFRWCNNVGEASDERILPPETRSHHCKCSKCTMKNCPSKPPLHFHPPFKDNIMTFTDQCTMTPKLKDVSCECATPSRPQTSDVSVSSSDIAVKDCTCDDRTTRRRCSLQKPPPPILKKCYKDVGYGCSHVPTDYHHDKGCDTNLDCRGKPSFLKSIKSYLKLQRDYEPAVPMNAPRKNIYNEGISDRVANNLPLTPHMVTPIKAGRSRLLLRTRSYADTDIPYSHRGMSKYHTSCRKSSIRTFLDYECHDVNHLVESPRIVHQPCTRQLLRMPLVKLPKKVLSSERDIESYVSSSRKNKDKNYKCRRN